MLLLINPCVLDSIIRFELMMELDIKYYFKVKNMIPFTTVLDIL